MKKILVIVGPTASGKSDLAVSLAKKFNGEVISADSRQVYKGLGIGTGKITKREMKGVRHHLLDVASQKQRFSADEYRKLAQKAIEDIASRGKLPILVGGTGLYIDVALGRINVPDIPPDLKLRKRLAGKSAAALFLILKKLDPKRARAIAANNSEKHNPPRLIRAIEIAKAEPAESATERPSLRLLPVFIGIKPTDAELKKRIAARLKKHLSQGMIAEARRLHANGLSWKRMNDLGLEYRYLALFLQGKIGKEELVEKLNVEIWRYAKRQMVWFKKNEEIRWFSINKKTGATIAVTSFLKK
jgi:tRNA dimethylallyltransferase